MMDIRRFMLIVRYANKSSLASRRIYDGAREDTDDLDDVPLYYNDCWYEQPDKSPPSNWLSTTTKRSNKCGLSKSATPGTSRTWPMVGQLGWRLCLVAVVAFFVIVCDDQLALRANSAVMTSLAEAYKRV